MGTVMTDALPLRRPRPRTWATALAGRALPATRPGPAAGVLAALISVAIATLAIYGLKRVAPVVSLSVVYLPAVVLVSVYWGAVLGLFTALVSGAAFNFFHLPPTGRFAIADGRSWVALAAFMVVTLVVSAIAELARSRALEADRRRGEADLTAAMTRELLLGEDTPRALGATAHRVAEALGLASAAITLTETTASVASSADGTTGDRRLTLELRDEASEPIGALLVPRELEPETAALLRDRVVPTLEALVAIARRRDALQAQRVETEALRRSDDIKTALLRAVSHDLRTPLTSVVAAGHALGASGLPDEDRAELSAAVVSEATRLSALVDNLLDLSRLQAGAARPRRDWLSVEELVYAAAENTTAPIELRLTVDPDVPEIRADAAQLERALANLLENARRYGDGGPVSVHIRSSGDRVLIRVVDRGPGIDPAERDRIFEPFYRGRGAAAAERTGSGLGLAIVKGFVEANGGAIAVESLPRQGTSFVISLPAGQPAPVEEISS
jgi:two-component system sensor histidine kinase KdpD